MSDLLFLLMKEYQRLIEIEAEYDQWKKYNPELNGWEYRKQRVSKARLERIGIMVRQTMIDFERKHK